MLWFEAVGALGDRVRKRRAAPGRPVDGRIGVDEDIEIPLDVVGQPNRGRGRVRLAGAQHPVVPDRAEDLVVEVQRGVLGDVDPVQPGADPRGAAPLVRHGPLQRDHPAGAGPGGDVQGSDPQVGLTVGDLDRAGAAGVVPLRPILPHPLAERLEPPGIALRPGVVQNPGPLLPAGVAVGEHVDVAAAFDPGRRWKSRRCSQSE